MLWMYIINLLSGNCGWDTHVACNGLYFFESFE